MDSIKKFKCICAYDGTSFCGWQAQPSKTAIQDFIELRLSDILKSKIRIHGSGRTDAGVHADAQVFHFDASWKHSDEALFKALKSGMPETLQIISLNRTKDDFHARYSAKGKRYIYNIRLGDSHPKNARFEWQLNRDFLDIDSMNIAAKKLLGTHDFTSFSASRGENVKDNPVKTLYELKVTKRGNLITISTKGSGYMYKMVRLLVGALVNVGLGKLTDCDIENILNAKNRNISKFQAVPAKGLTLNKVYYNKPPHFFTY